MRAETNAQSKIFNWDNLWETVLMDDKSHFLPDVAHLDSDEEEWRAGWNQYCLAAGLLQDTDFAGLENETCGPELIVL